MPPKSTQAKAMVNHVIEELGGLEKAKDFTYSTSGHSLGAIITDFTAGDIYCQERLKV